MPKKRFSAEQICGKDHSKCHSHHFGMNSGVEWTSDPANITSSGCLCVEVSFSSPSFAVAPNAQVIYVIR
jgi:hypothetical protein